MDSPALSHFLDALGKVQHHLHTVIVGLSAVESSIATKPERLDITWNPTDPVGSAREARRFVLRSTLVLAAEELGEYATTLLRYRMLTDSSVHLPEQHADRLREISRGANVQPRYLEVAPILVRHWRNRIVHKNSGARLTNAEEETLCSAANEVYDAYKHVDVKRLLKDFAEDKPSLKDVTVLLAMSIRFARQVDESLPAIESAADVGRWLEVEGLLQDVLRMEKEAANGGSPDPRGRSRKMLLTKSPLLADPYRQFGAT